MSVSILIGDCRERMKELPDTSVDSVVCDPPYHLTSIVKRFGGARAENEIFATTNKTNCYKSLSTGFMGQKWDGGDIAQDPAMWAEVLRVLKPGGFLAAFSGCRTYHRMATAIEDAGFEIREMLSWNFGSGFPKSLNVSAKIDRCLCDEDLHDLRKQLAAKNAIPGDAEQDLQPSLRGKVNLEKQGGPTLAAKPEDDGSLRGVRDASDSISVLHPAGSEASLLSAMQRGVPGAGLGEARAQGRASANAGELREGGDEGGEEPSLEGGRLPQESPRELSGREVSEGAGLGSADGASGRLHDAAPLSDGADVRLPADADRGGEPQGSQPSEQRSVESGTLADERRPQARGAWPLCGGCGKPRVPKGLGTALKPAHEPICLARRPLESTVAANVLKHGTGALNIDGCRIEARDPPLSHGGKGNKNTYGEWPQEYQSGDGREYSAQGRWPANLCHDGSDEVLAGFPSETTGGGTAKGAKGGAVFPAWGSETTGYSDSGSAARFFYCAKAASDERGEGNNHPTVKPIALMRWLCRLVTPPGGTILDPFMGSGSTLIAADAEQFNAIGCELSPEYAAIAERRIRDAAGMFADVKVAA